MADVSKIEIESGTYDIKDTTAREKINTLIDEIETEKDYSSLISSKIGSIETDSCLYNKTSIHGYLRYTLGQQWTAGSQLEDIYLSQQLDTLVGIQGGTWISESSPYSFSQCEFWNRTGYACVVLKPTQTTLSAGTVIRIFY